MAQSHGDRPNEWSQMDLSDLIDTLLRGDSIAEIAEFLCRSRYEVRAKVIELADACKNQLGEVC